MQVQVRVPPKKSVALETTLLLHGVPASSSLALAHDLAADVQIAGAEPALIGVVQGNAIAGMTDAELQTLLHATKVAKANTSNLGVLLARKSHAATTVSTTMEIAAAAGIRVFATGGLGGVHQGWAQHLDVSADLMAFTRFPVAVVTSGCKSILDVVATRELLETLGVPVVGWRTDRFPAFYTRESAAGVDARFDDMADLARFVAMELARTGRGVVVANPIPHADEISQSQFSTWLAEAQRAAALAGATGRDATPAVLGQLHTLSNGATLKANIALVRNNARVAGQLAAAMQLAES
ncbi:MAG TPA: pseudouridine-5'-phosphate glycosidase [Phycisphaerales bacterium]|nr:pseudouridine-5'-phosphate glycosidase [Phycisphaerales bacterium]